MAAQLVNQLASFCWFVDCKIKLVLLNSHGSCFFNALTNDVLVRVSHLRCSLANPDPCVQSEYDHAREIQRFKSLFMLLNSLVELKISIVSWNDLKEKILKLVRRPVFQRLYLKLETTSSRDVEDLLVALEGNYSLKQKLPGLILGELDEYPTRSDDTENFAKKIYRFLLAKLRGLFSRIVDLSFKNLEISFAIDISSSPIPSHSLSHIEKAASKEDREVT